MLRVERNANFGVTALHGPDGWNRQESSEQPAARTVGRKLVVRVGADVAVRRGDLGAPGFRVARCVDLGGFVERDSLAVACTEALVEGTYHGQVLRGRTR